jgi:hypothetical protein
LRLQGRLPVLRGAAAALVPGRAVDVHAGATMPLGRAAERPARRPRTAAPPSRAA